MMLNGLNDYSRRKPKPPHRDFWTRKRERIAKQKAAVKNEN